MADDFFADILDDLFEDLVSNPSNPFAILPLPTPPPPPPPTTATRQRQLLPPLAGPHTTTPTYQRNLPFNSTSLPSLHRGGPSPGIGQPALPNPPTSRPCDPPQALTPPPSLDPQSRASISQNLSALPSSQNGHRPRQGVNRSTPRPWDFSRLPDSDDDHFLEAIVSGAFSSPSIPPQSPLFNQSSGASPPPPPPAELLPGPSGDPTTLTFSSADEGSTNMPPTRDRKRRVDGANASPGSPVSKRRRPSQETPRTPGQSVRRQAKRPRTTPTYVELDVDENVFLDSDDKDIINLADPDEYPKAKSEPEVDNSVKLGTFQCVICMDNVADLTVTFCGHLFCAECLHSSLHIDVTKKICPICRQKIDTRPASGKFTTKSKGFWPLELKLMTAKRSGKLPAR